MRTPTDLRFFASTLRRWDKSAAIRELFSFLGIGSKQVIVIITLNVKAPSQVHLFAIQAIFQFLRNFSCNKNSFDR